MILHCKNAEMAIVFYIWQFFTSEEIKKVKKK